MITYEWDFWNFEVTKSQDGLADVVKAVHWVYRGIDENGIKAEIAGVEHLRSPNTNFFIPFEQITKEWVLKQITTKEDFDLEGMQAQITKQIDLIKNPPIINKPPPF